MDIAGAKALKQRLGPNGTGDTPPDFADIPEDVPPVYHWTGVSKPAPDTSPDVADDDPAASGTSLVRRLGLSFR
jgi:hypothetical protein